MAISFSGGRNDGIKSNWTQSNLYRNPFGELTSEQRVEVAVVDIDSIIKLVAQSDFHDPVAVQFIGRCGRGKTTRMLSLANRLDESSYTYIPENKVCPPIPVGQPVLIDEAQRMSRRVQRQVFGSGLPLVLATHRDLTGGLRRFGYSVYTERIESSNTPELLCQVLNRRIEASRITTGSIPVVSLDFARRLWGRFGTDIRGIENHLYELAQAQVRDHGKVRFDD